MQRIARELAERSEEQRMQEARELDAFIERTDKKLAAMSEEERAELERRDEALWQRIKKAIEEENP
ncbi:MAG: hypothetical protein K2J30_00500 [Clostridia bacterium]|nr:hypothetical protein [Clostridia bacterium]